MPDNSLVGSPLSGSIKKGGLRLCTLEEAAVIISIEQYMRYK